MKKILKFSKLFRVAIIFYIVFLLGGAFLIFNRGFNKGVDFQAGLVAEIRFAPTVVTMSYDGTDTLTFSQDSEGVYLIKTSISAENLSSAFLYSEYKKVADFVNAAKDIDGFEVQVHGNGNASLASVFTSSTENTKLSTTPLRLYSLEGAQGVLSSDDLRQSLASLGNITVKQIGESEERTFQFRLSSDDEIENTSAKLKEKLTSALSKTYGIDNYAYLTTDFMGSQFSASLIVQSGSLVLFSLALIFLYVMFRFKWSFSLAAIIALIFDSFTMVVYMSITQIEFSTFTVAALLTVIGYSVNDTVILFDRVRENIRLFPEMVGTDIIDKSVSEALGRSIITTITTIVAVLILFLFTGGNAKDFASVLMVGLISGVVTSIILVPAIINLWCRTKKGQDIIKFGAVK